ncbi:hypothetical protein VE02_07307 [Pseudogymnoascus sp. 03VT05]|nr:hypothetical protein VE02_07307 [Pseudogymnoascus sp. 03VT05]
MSDIEAVLEHLANLPLYEDEKPYLALLPPSHPIHKLSPGKRLNNLEWESYDTTIHDIRPDIQNYKIDECGFQVLDHESKVKNLETVESVVAYRRETEGLLKEVLGAEFAFCYDLALRENVKWGRSELDLLDPLLVQGPARGVHNDVTAMSGPAMINRHLPEDVKHQYCSPYYRYRIVNTWRTLNPVAKDRPLTFCDYQTVDPDDLMPADRIIPVGASEVYYLLHNLEQRWVT